MADRGDPDDTRTGASQADAQSAGLDQVQDATPGEAVIPEGGIPTPRRYVAMAAVSFGTALVVIDSGIANVALPTIAHDLNVDNSSAVAVVTVYQLTLVMLLLPFAALAERIGSSACTSSAS